MTPPLAMRLLLRLGAAFPETTLKTALRMLLSLPFARGAHGAVKGNLRRIQKYRGGPADEASIDRLFAEYCERYASMVATLCRLPRLWDRLEELVHVEILPQIEKGLAQRRGLILASPHFGDPFLAIHALAKAGLPVTVLIVGAVNYKWVERNKVRILEAGSSAVDCLAALARNELVLLYDDLPAFPDGRVAELFGAPVHPPNGAARLALAADCPILPIYCVHHQGRHRLVADDLIPRGLPQERIEALLLRSLERFAGEYPAQWLVFQDLWDLEGMAQWGRQLLKRL